MAFRTASPTALARSRIVGRVGVTVELGLTEKGRGGRGCSNRGRGSGALTLTTGMRPELSTTARYAALHPLTFIRLLGTDNNMHTHFHMPVYKLVCIHACRFTCVPA